MSSANAPVNQHAPGTRLIAGVPVPDSPVITAAIEYGQRISEPYLFNHAMRSWLFAETIGRTQRFDYDHEVVAIGTILHDIGLTAARAGVSRIAGRNSSGTWSHSIRRPRWRFIRSRK